MNDRLAKMAQEAKAKIEAEKNKPQVLDPSVALQAELGAKFRAIVEPVLQTTQQTLKQNGFCLARVKIISVSGQPIVHATFSVCRDEDEGKLSVPRSHEYTVGWNRDGGPSATVTSGNPSKPEYRGMLPMIGFSGDLTRENVEKLVELAFEDFQRASGI